jgi:hypothetical protein
VLSRENLRVLQVVGDLNPEKLSLIGDDGRHISGEKSTKEAFLQRCMCRERQSVGAVVYLKRERIILTDMPELQLECQTPLYQHLSLR